MPTLPMTSNAPLAPDASATMEMPALSAREIACLQMAADGKRTLKMAEELSLATVTVEMHLRNIRRKLGARTMPQAVAIALRMDLIT